MKEIKDELESAKYYICPGPVDILELKMSIRTLIKAVSLLCEEMQSLENKIKKLKNI